MCKCLTLILFFMVTCVLGSSLEPTTLQVSGRGHEKKIALLMNFLAAASLKLIVIKLLVIVVALAAFYKGIHLAIWYSDWLTPKHIHHDYDHHDHEFFDHESPYSKKSLIPSKGYEYSAGYQYGKGDPHVTSTKYNNIPYKEINSGSMAHVMYRGVKQNYSPDSASPYSAYYSNQLTEQTGGEANAQDVRKSNDSYDVVKQDNGPYSIGNKQMNSIDSQGSASEVHRTRFYDADGSYSVKV